MSVIRNFECRISRLQTIIHLLVCIVYRKIIRIGRCFYVITGCSERVCFECEIRKFSKRTIKGYRNNNALFFTFIGREFGITELEKVTPAHIKCYVQFLMKKGLAETYINGILKCFRAFFKYSVQEEYNNDSPCKKVSWLKEPKVIIKSFMDAEVFSMLKVFDYSDYLNARNKTILAFLFDTGMRNLELCMLKHQDIKETYVIIKGKGNKERLVGKSPLLEKHIIKYERIKEQYFKDKRIIDDNFFLSRTGKPLTVKAVERVLRQAGKMTGIRNEIRCSPHTCRHYFAQAQLRNGLDVYSLSRILGHENISITKRYLQSLQDKDIVQMSIKTSPLMNL